MVKYVQDPVEIDSTYPAPCITHGLPLTVMKVLIFTLKIVMY